MWSLWRAAPATMTKKKTLAMRCAYRSTMTIIHRTTRYGIVLLLGFFIAGLTALPAKAQGDFAGLVDIGSGRKLYLECRGSGSPTVILEAGTGDRGDIWSTDESNPQSSRTMVLPGVA